MVKVIKRTAGNSYTLKRLEAALQHIEMLPAVISNHFATINQRVSELTERQQQTQTEQAAEWRQPREQLAAQAASLKIELERQAQEQAQMLKGALQQQAQQHAQTLRAELQQQAQTLRWLIELVEHWHRLVAR